MRTAQTSVGKFPLEVFDVVKFHKFESRHQRLELVPILLLASCGRVRQRSFRETTGLTTELETSDRAKAHVNFRQPSIDSVPLLVERTGPSV